MRLGRKLDGLSRELGLSQRSAVEAVPLPEPRGNPLRLENLMAGDLIHHDVGACFVVETVHHLEARHGLHAFGEVLGVSGSQLALISKDPELTYADLSRAVFLDTETTGLGMGAGTYVFLVGAGYFGPDGFHVKQFFLRGPNEETAFLAALGSFLSEFSSLVTFNGKAFDWPMLESRFVRQRRAVPLNDPPHVDLLHPARRLWKRRLESCALSSLESNILGVARSKEDVPGWEIPRRYFTYQRTGDGRELEGVFYHNLQDILSLATLTVHIDRVLSDPLCGLVTEGIDFFCLGRAFDRAGDPELAVICYEEGLRRGLLVHQRGECLMSLAIVQKRERRWDAALQCWDLLIDEGGSEALFARLELAKFYEHVERDYLQALDHVQSALRLAELYDSAWPEASQRDLEHRQSRLLNRSAREGSWSGSRR